MNNENADVISINSEFPIFSPKLRRQLEHEMKPYTDKSHEAITSVESAICTFLITTVRRFATDIGKGLAEKLTGKLERIGNHE